MEPRHRDGVLALTTLVLLVGLSARVGAGIDPLDPWAALAGVSGSLALEAAFLSRPARTRALWERPAVQGLAVACVLGIALLAARTGAGRFTITALAWGLVAYLVLLCIVLSGYPNPVGLVMDRE